MPLARYRYGPETLAALADNGVPWQAAHWVLHHAHPVVRRHTGAAVLHVTGADMRGDLLMVTLLETADDDVYEIQTARYLDPEESAAASFALRNMRSDDA